LNPFHAIPLFFKRLRSNKVVHDVRLNVKELDAVLKPATLASKLFGDLSGFNEGLVRHELRKKPDLVSRRQIWNLKKIK
jgi:hypothetical protein